MQRRHFMMLAGLGLGLKPDLRRHRAPREELVPLTLVDAAPAGIRVGYALPLHWEPTASEVSVFAENFNAVVADNACKWNQLSSADGDYDFSKTSAYLADAASINATSAAWHTFGWHKSLPTWVSDKLPYAGWQADLEQFVDAAATHFSDWPFDRIDVWNEIFDGATAAGDTDHMFDSVWYQSGGNDPSYWHHLFHYCRSKFPDSALALPDFGLENGLDHDGAGLEDARWEKRKREWMLKYLEDAIDAGVPIDILALQGHLHPKRAYDSAGVRQFVQDATSLGLQVAITEHDVFVTDIPGFTDNAPETRLFAASVAERFMRDVLTYSNCNEITFWHALSGRMKVIEDGQPTELHAAAMRALRDAVPVAQRSIKKDRWFDLRGTIPPWFAATGEDPFMNDTTGLRVRGGGTLALPWSALRWIDGTSFSMRFQLNPDFQPGSGTHLIFKPEASDDRLELKYVAGSGDNRLAFRATSGGVETITETPHPNALINQAFNQVALRVDAATVSLCVNGGPVVSGSGSLPGIERVWFGSDTDGTSTGEARFSTMTFHETPLSDAELVAATS